MPTDIDERAELPLGISGPEDRGSKIVGCEEAARLGQIRGSADELWVVAVEILPRLFCQFRTRVDPRGVVTDSACIDVRAFVEMADDLLEHSELFLSLPGVVSLSMNIRDRF